jgi:pterin-4a-carbinolamine dehydratase
VTPDAVLHLLDSHGVDLSTKKVLIVGRSRIVGSPLAHALTQRNATVRSRPVPTQTLTPPNPRPPSQVTLAHTSTSDLAALCLASDLVISCAGVPGLIQPDMISPGAGVVSVGVTFDAATKSLLPDVSADVPAFGHASFLVTTPGGVGPLPLALLLRNVVTAASRRSAPLTATAATPAASVCEVRSFVVTSPAWAVDSDRSVLFREFKMGSHLEASRFLESAARIGDELDHHIERRCAPSLSFLFRRTPLTPTLSLSLFACSSVLHKCEEGVVLKVELKTTSVDAVTGNDLVLAARLDALSLGAPSPDPVVPSSPVFHPPAAIANMRTAQVSTPTSSSLHPSHL